MRYTEVMIKIISIIFVFALAVPALGQAPSPASPILEQAPSTSSPVSDNVNDVKQSSKGIRRNAQDSSRKSIDRGNARRKVRDVREDSRENARKKRKSVRDIKIRRKDINPIAVQGIRATAIEDDDEVNNARSRIRTKTRTQTRTRTRGRSGRDGVDREKVDHIKRLKKEQFDAFHAKRSALKEEIKKKREEFKRNLETRKLELKDRMRAKKVELKEKLKKIKDERKQRIVERINERIDTINTKITDRFISMLEKIEAVLARVSSRADKAEAHGNDVSAVRSAIVQASTAIVSSRVVVETQSGKVYTITIRNENTLRSDIKQTRDEIHTDLRNVRDTLFVARDAIKQAVLVLSQIPRINEFEVESEEIEHAHSEGEDDSSDHHVE